MVLTSPASSGPEPVSTNERDNATTVLMLAISDVAMRVPGPSARVFG
jgi:hypothetical protein